MRRPIALAPIALLALAAGCGGSDGSSDEPPDRPKPTASASAFPSASGKTLDALRAGLPEGPILAPSTTSSLEVGRNRVGFALFTPDKKFVTNAAVALYTTRHDGTGVRGPYVARLESLEVKPQFESQTTASDPGSAKSVYVADVPIPKAGKTVITGVARIGGRVVRTSGFELRIPAHPSGGPPDVGQKPPLIHTPTLSSVAGDARKIDTRVPPATDLLKDDYARVVGKKPIVITFATPLLCQSRVCGPVVDIVEQARAETSSDVAFIHQEIYNDNQVNKGFRSQVDAWHLPTEPWTFVVDKKGRVSARFEGAFSTGELERAIEKVTHKT
ncbi:MAG TPA: hypothetical protein VGJ32_11370 [Solirubrobacteraceae bacterium]